ncbi:MAG: YkgJ family cysteine cluster protein [Proteobacteria bacterium]|nr:YkgJ family cysteine cluster protein [Pseudomonadota bacterium]
MPGMAVGIVRSCALFPLRAVVFAIGFVDYYFERAADWIVGARAATEYVREGSCVRCGRCCSLLGIEMPAWAVKRDWLVRLLVAWHDSALNFEFQGRAEGMLAYRCRYYRDGEGGTPGGCSIYPFRHRLCRFFPRQRLYGSLPLHDQCGFRFVKRKVIEQRRQRIHDGKPLFDDIMHPGIRS